MMRSPGSLRWWHCRTVCAGGWSASHDIVTILFDIVMFQYDIVMFQYDIITFQYDIVTFQYDIVTFQYDIVTFYNVSIWYGLLQSKT
jgi:hypothetical protein